MSTLVRSMYRESQFGVPVDLDPAGTSLENPYAYDSAARELKSMADQGLIKILSEKVQPDSAPLISRIIFARLR